MNESLIVIGVVCAYLCAMMVIGIAARPRDASKKEYYIAGKRLPYWVIAFSMNATGESAWLLLGLSGTAYVAGASAYWVVVGETLGIWMSWRLVAKRLSQEGAIADAVTVPDVLAAKLGDPMRLLRLCSVVIILVMVLVYVAAQMLATGKAFESFLGWPYAVGVLAGGFVTIVYTSFGGFRGVAYTDTAQALLMLFAVFAVPVMGLVEAGGVSAVVSSLKDANEGLLQLFPASLGMSAAIVAVASSLAVGLPFLGVPQLLVRYIAINDEKEVVRASRISVIVIFALGFGAVSTGLVGRALTPGLDDAETIMPLLSDSLFPPFVTGLLVAAVLSAIMSTVSSLMNLASSAIVGDVYHQMFRPDVDTKRLGRLGVWVTAFVGIGGALIALRQDGLIFQFVLFAWAGLGAAFAPPVLCMLWWRGTTWQGALTGMIGGFFATVLWLVKFKDDFYGLYEMIPGLAAGVVCTVVVSLLTRPKPNTDTGHAQ